MGSAGSVKGISQVLIERLGEDLQHQMRTFLRPLHLCFFEKPFTEMSQLASLSECDLGSYLASRRENLGKHTKGDRRDAGLKMGWTKPLPSGWPMTGLWRPFSAGFNRSTNRLLLIITGKNK
jgi:hypothetical protein